MAQHFNKSVALPLASAALAASVSCGPRTDMDPVEARAKFSSKSLSMDGAPAQPSAQPAAQPSASAADSVPSGDSSTSPAVFTRAGTAAEPASPDKSAPTAQVAAVTPAPAPPAPATKHIPLFGPDTGSVQAPQATKTDPVVADEPALVPAPTEAESPAAVPPPALHEPVVPSESITAHRILVEAAASKWPSLRANALEAAMRSPALLDEIAPAALADENRGVRFVACMTIAEARHPRFAELVRPLASDPSASVRAAAMLALSRSGVKVNFSPLAEMVFDNDPEIRANAYLVLGELGNESAIPLIRESLGKGMKLINPIRVRLVDLAAAEALVKLGDEREIEPIRAALFAPPEQGELTLVACDSIRRLHDEVSRPMLERIVTAGGNARRSPEIHLAACRALAALGNRNGPATIAREYVKHPDARIRAQAAILLGEIGTPDTRAELTALLRDQNPSVQIAAAGGLEAATSDSFQAQAD